MRAGAGEAEPRFAYERLAAEIVDQVTAGTFRPGDRLPSVRRMSRQKGISVSTVLQTYRLLEARRVIEARPQSGFYVLGPARRPIPVPARSEPVGEPREITTAELMTDVLEAAGDPGMVPLGAAIPDAALLPTRRLSRLAAQVTRREAARAATYMGPRGVPELRRELAQREWGAGYAANAEDLVVTCGATEALSIALRVAAAPGDTIAVESPTFFGVLQMIEALGMRALEVPTDPETGICLDRLESLLDAHDVRACVVTPNFQNPLGALMPDASKAELVRMLTTRGVVIIEDDAHGDLHHEGARPRSLKVWDTEQNVIRCGSLSKTCAPGYRIGWIVSGDRFRRSVMRMKQASTIALPAAPQLAVAAFLSAGNFEPHLRRLRSVFQTNVRRLAFEVAGRFPDGTRVSRPVGGFVLWVELPDGSDALRLQRKARDKGISISPGPIFSAGGGYANFVRFSAGHPWSERTERALEVLAGMVEQEMEPPADRVRSRRWSSGSGWPPAVGS